MEGVLSVQAANDRYLIKSQENGM